MREGRAIRQGMITRPSTRTTLVLPAKIWRTPMVLIRVIIIKEVQKVMLETNTNETEPSEEATRRKVSYQMVGRTRTPPHRRSTPGR